MTIFIGLILIVLTFIYFVCHLVQIVKWWLLGRPILEGRGQFSSLKTYVSTLNIQNALSNSWQVATPCFFCPILKFVSLSESPEAFCYSASSPRTLM